MEEFDYINVLTGKNGQEYLKEEILKDGPKSRSTAVFFRNKHKSSENYIISLKISLNNKNKDGTLTAKPNKSITLSGPQIDALINYIEKNYRALSLGEKSYLSIKDKDILPVLKQINSVGLSSKEMVEKLYDSGILTDNLSVAITAAQRSNVIKTFEDEINNHNKESFWQELFEKNKWILGSEYLKIIKDRNIDTKHIADFLMTTFDGFLDLVEIKKTDIKIWTQKDSHGNYCPTAETTSAIMQCLNYLDLIEHQSDSKSFHDRIGNASVIKPKCLLVIGRSNDWNSEQKKAFRTLNSAYHQLHIITYDQLLSRAKILINFEEKESDVNDICHINND